MGIRPTGKMLFARLIYVDRYSFQGMYEELHVPWNPWNRVIGHICKYMDPWDEN